MYDDKEALVAARAVAAVQERGKKILHDAAREATGDMAKMLRHFSSKQGKIEALKHHALYMGIGTEFMGIVAPKADSMIDELTELTGDGNEAKVLTALWLAKVFIEIEKGLRNEQQ